MGKRRAGRPEIDPSQKRSEIFRFVATKGEAAKIRSAARKAGLSLSDYLRSVALPKRGE